MGARLYHVSLVLACIAAAVFAIVVDDDGALEARAELSATGLSGVIPGVGRLEAPLMHFVPRGRVLSLSDARIERDDLELRIGEAQLRLVSQQAHLQDIEGRVGTTRVVVGDARVAPGDLEAHEIELGGSLRGRTVEHIRVGEVSVAMDGLERWRQRAQQGWATERNTEAGPPKVYLRVQRLIERQRAVVLRNVELSFVGGARVRARAVTVPKGGGACLLQDVTIEAHAQRRVFEEMSLDLDTLELVPRRSLVARTLGQQWGGGVRLDLLEVTP